MVGGDAGCTFHGNEAEAVGIDAGYFAYLADFVRKERIAHGSVLQLGKQHIAFDFETLIEITSHFGLATMEHGKFLLNSQDRLLPALIRENVQPSDIAAFSALGFDRIDSVDFSDGEGASIIWNLNNPGLIGSIEKPYDLVVDGGTLEHIFHLPNALANIADVLNVGGYVLHANPMNNFVDHGFYQFSPTLFLDYYAANNFDIVDAVIARYPGNGGPVFSRPYERSLAALHDFPYTGTLDSGLFDFRFAARKRADSTANRVPTQYLYESKPLGNHPDVRSTDKLVVWGAGSAATTFIARRLDASKIDFFIDTDTSKHGSTCLGRPIRAPEALRGVNDSVVIIGSVRHENVIRLRVSRDYSENVRAIITLNDLANLSCSDLQGTVT